MNFLIDENLPPRLAIWLCERGHDAVHVKRLGLERGADDNLALIAIQNARAIVTKDGDFDGRTDVKVLRLVVGNTSTKVLLAWLEQRLDAAISRFEAGEAFVRLR